MLTQRWLHEKLVYDGNSHYYCTDQGGCIEHHGDRNTHVELCGRWIDLFSERLLLPPWTIAILRLDPTAIATVPTIPGICLDGIGYVDGSRHLHNEAEN